MVHPEYRKWIFWIGPLSDSFELVLTGKWVPHPYVESALLVFALGAKGGYSLIRAGTLNPYRMRGRFPRTKDILRPLTKGDNKLALTKNTIRRSSIAAILLATLFTLCRFYGQAPSAKPAGAQTRLALQQAISKMNGDSLKVSVVEVTYEPGASSARHSHPCPVIGYVLEGVLRSQVQGQPAALYKAGETFYEPANGVHEISANASTTQRARFVAYFLCDHDTPLSVAAAASEQQKEHQ